VGGGVRGRETDDGTPGPADAPGAHFDDHRALITGCGGAGARDDSARTRFLEEEGWTRGVYLVVHCGSPGVAQKPTVTLDNDIASMRRVVTSNAAKVTLRAMV